ncbi:MAG: hypothetical protein ACI4EV_03175 [Lachnospiraceae bacterium]
MARQYIYGSTARAVEVMEPDSIKQAKEQRRYERQEQERLREARRQAKKLHKVNLIYTFALIGAMSVLIYMLVGYVQLQASIQVNAAQVTQLEQELSKLTESNNLTALELDTNIDYNEIFEIATQELGMVYPDKSQVIEYNSVASEYVKQYQDIPE